MCTSQCLSDDQVELAELLQRCQERAIGERCCEPSAMAGLVVAARSFLAAVDGCRCEDNER